MKYSAIEIIETESDKVEHTIKMDPPKGERMAERTEDGVNRNLDHDRFYTRLVEAPSDE